MVIQNHIQWQLVVEMAEGAANFHLWVNKWYVLLPLSFVSGVSSHWNDFFPTLQPTVVPIAIKTMFRSLYSLCTATETYGPYLCESFILSPSIGGYHLLSGLKYSEKVLHKWVQAEENCFKQVICVCKCIATANISIACTAYTSQKTSKPKI